MNAAEHVVLSNVPLLLAGKCFFSVLVPDMGRKFAVPEPQWRCQAFTGQDLIFISLKLQTVMSSMKF